MADETKTGEEAGQETQAALLAALTAAQASVQDAKQVAQQAAQATQRAEQAVATAVQASRGQGAETQAATIETDISPASITDAWRTNLKRLEDEFRHESLYGIRVANRTFDQLAAAHTAQVVALNAQTLRGHTNSLTHDGDLNKQHLAHRDLATDRTWNIDEVAALVARSSVFQDAIAAAVARGVNASQGSAG